MTVTHNNTIFIGATQFQVSCNVDDAYVALTIDHQIIGTAFISGGFANISFSPLLTLDTMTVAITAFNYIPYLAEVPIIPASGPYVIYNGHNLDDNAGNSNGLADYGESILLDLEIRNVGIALANGINVSLTSQDPYITMTDTSEYYGNIMPDSALTLNAAFSFLINDSIPDKHNAVMNFSATDGTNAWAGAFSITLHAPILAFDDYSISDPTGNNNSKIDAGETVVMSIDIENNGSAEALNVIGILSSTDPYVTINSTSPLSYGNIPDAGSAQQSYTVSAAIATPAGHQADFNLFVSADSGYVCDHSFSLIIGEIPVCIIDLDVNSNSGPAMQTAIQNLNLTCDYFTAFPPDLNLYSSVFLCLGIYWDNYTLDMSEGQLLANYLNNGGQLYMEGGDTWYYDQQTPVHSMFNVNAIADGTSDLGLLLGDTASFTDGMSFNYSGDNNYVDHIDAVSPAFPIFYNQLPFYGSGVAYDEGTYKTIAVSHEFGGLDDAVSPSTKDELMAEYLKFFGLYTDEVIASFFAVPTTISAGDTVNFYDNSTGNVSLWFWNLQGGTPQWSSIQNPSVAYNIPGFYDVELIVSDGINIDTITINNYIEVIGGSNTLYGNVNYDNSIQTPMDNMTLIIKTLSNISHDTVITDASGAYSFSGLMNENYLFEMACNKIWGGVNASDGLLVMRHFVGLNILSGLPLKASDVDASNFINTADALMCVQRFVGLINAFPAGDWIYDNDTINLNGGITFAYNPRTLCYGDVDASYQPPLGKRLPDLELLNDGVNYVKAGEIIELPLTVDRHLNIGAISLAINYPDSYIEFLGLRFSQKGLTDPLYKASNGEIRIGWYDVNPIDLFADDELIVLQFKAKNIGLWPEAGLELGLNTCSEIADLNAKRIRDITFRSKVLLADPIISTKFVLETNSPNPFNDKTEISFVLPEAAYVDLKIYNILGELIGIVKQNEFYNKGRNTVSLEKGVLSNGVYIYKLDAVGELSKYSASRNMLVK